jgi:hypothetical protein
LPQDVLAGAAAGAATGVACVITAGIAAGAGWAGALAGTDAAVFTPLVFSIAVGQSPESRTKGHSQLLPQEVAAGAAGAAGAALT